MKRITLIGENSNQYISILINAWNSGESVVLIDWRIPFESSYKLICQTNAYDLYIEKKFAKKIDINKYPEISFHIYENQHVGCEYLSDENQKKFIENYSRNEAVILFSSGTTGNAKGIILTHYAINTNADAIQDYMNIESDDCLYLSKPLSHSSTLTGELLVTLKSKATLIIAPTIVPPRYVFDNIEKYKISVLCINPTLLKLYTDEILRESHNITSLKRIYVSGSILSDDLYEYSHNAFRNIPIYNVYGLSEAAPRVSAQTKNCCKHNSVGKPIKGVTIKIIDNNRYVNEFYKIGVIFVNTPSLFSGYISEDKYNLLDGRWWNTGDLGYFDEDDELHVIGRIDDMISFNSHNLYPYSIEKSIMAHPYIDECIVFAYTNKIESDNKTNTHSQLICIYLGVEGVALNEIIDLCKDQLASYEIPTQIYHVNQFEINNNGKLNRKLTIHNFIKEMF